MFSIISPCTITVKQTEENTDYEVCFQIEVSLAAGDCGQTVKSEARCLVFSILVIYVAISR